MLLMGLKCTEHGWGKHIWAGSVNSFKNGTQKRKKNEIEYPRTVEQIQMHYIHIMRKPREGREKGKERKIRSNNDGEFPQIDIGHQTIDRVR